ncbi:GntR family transcriptional regulator [Vibrio sonorensis]|uniref:GntR family transcriptional regulator n=1 Tax=Vibrio sonorensis TaxID=1004316 RepID=UPI0008DAEBC0|nr:GntR family transcriptional regulator [Vibrio sonorensis]
MSQSKPTSAEILASRVIELVIKQGLSQGAHIKEVEFSKELKVSRTPIRNAFLALQESGYLVKKPNQGFFLERVPKANHTQSPSHESNQYHDLDPICYQIGQDYLSGKLDKNFTENDLIKRYSLGRKSVQEALITMEKESWLTRSLGYGWEFNEFISSPSAYMQSYRFRKLIEPEALREPSFHIDTAQIQMLKLAQIEILNNKQKLVSAAEMFNAGVLFHESIVAMSGNLFLLDALKRVNRLRRLIEFNVNGKRPIPKKECEEHIQLLTLIEEAKLAEAADFLELHLERTAKEKEKIAESIFG